MKYNKPDWAYWLVFCSILGVSFATMALLFKPFLTLYMPIFNLLNKFAFSFDSMFIFFAFGLIHAAVICAYIAFFPFVIANKIVDYIYPNSKA